LIIDVRDNGGGARDSLRHIAGALMKAGARPRVVNAAVYRIHPEHGQGLMGSRFLYPENWGGWTAQEREAIAEFRKGFKPEWAPPREGYSEWHYMVLSAGKENEARFDRPVAVLMNGKCFSATDVLLSGLKGMENVTLVGTASGGGSANVNTVTLGTEPLKARLGTMVSFQADGRLFDTHGVEADVQVEPVPGYFVGGEDNQLEEAVRVVQR
jgi:C-terminal processing protease CtpA/Prc